MILPHTNFHQHSWKTIPCQKYKRPFNILLDDFRTSLFLLLVQFIALNENRKLVALDIHSGVTQ